MEALGGRVGGGGGGGGGGQPGGGAAWGEEKPRGGGAAWLAGRDSMGARAQAGASWGARASGRLSDVRFRTRTLQCRSIFSGKASGNSLLRKRHLPLYSDHMRA